MPDKKARHYHISLMSSSGEPLPSIEVLADEIKHGEHPDVDSHLPIILLLGGEEVGKFASRRVAGWWTTEV